MSQNLSNSEFIGSERAIADTRRLLDAFRRRTVSDRELQLERNTQLAALSLRLGLPRTAERALAGEFTS